jgi:hypothetical protein
MLHTDGFIVSSGSASARAPSGRRLLLLDMMSKLYDLAAWLG